jgi:hypothetical protein
MTTAYQKRRNKDRKHAALIKRDPTLREALYGTGPQPPERKAETRETAQGKDDRNG